MIIDGHSHLTFPVESHIDLMDQAKIDKTVLFSTSLHPETAKNAQEFKEAILYLHDLLAGNKESLVEARQKAIHELMQAIQCYPDQFVQKMGVRSSHFTICEE